MNWRAPVFIVLLALTASGLWWLLSGEQAGKRLSFALQEQQRAAGGNDYFMEGVRSEQFTAQGELRHVLQTPRIEHDPKSARVHMVSPHLFIQHEDGEPWLLRADNAYAFDQRHEIELSGAVTLSRGDRFKPSLTMNTESLHLDLEKQHASTEHEVRFSGPSGDIQAMGLEADLAAQVLSLQHQVRGRYVQP